MGLVSEEVVNFLESTGKPTGCFKTLKILHRVISLLDFPMGLLNQVVYIPVGSMLDIQTQRFSDGLRIAVMAIGCHFFRIVADRFLGLFEEEFRCF